MVAIIDAIRAERLDAEAAIVISNVESAPGLEKARERGVSTLVIPRRGREREEHDREIICALENHDVSIVCLAGYMRLLSGFFVNAFENRILNIHPSLLPAFPGVDAQRQALEAGVKITGCTVHLVDEQLDHGPIVVQRAVEVLDTDTVETLSARILEQEHQIYPEAIARVLNKEFRVEGQRTFIRPKT
jgi:phosphoribosylglycinamide formyltransferase 1